MGNPVRLPHHTVTPPAKSSGTSRINFRRSLATFGAQQVTQIVLVTEAQAIVQTEGFDGGDSLNAPASEIAALFQSVLNGVAVDVPPELLLPFAFEFGKPVFDEVARPRGWV